MVTWGKATSVSDFVCWLFHLPALSAVRYFLFVSGSGYSLLCASTFLLLTAFVLLGFVFYVLEGYAPSTTIRVPGGSRFEVLSTSAVEAGRYLRDWFEYPEMHYLFYQACNMAVRSCQLVSLPFCYYLFHCGCFRSCIIKLADNNLSS